MQFLLLIFIYFTYAKGFRDNEEVWNNQHRLSEIINRTLISFGFSHNKTSLLSQIPSYTSSIFRACDLFADRHSVDSDRFICCHPPDVRYLHNILISNNHFLYFTNGKKLSKQTIEKLNLPELRSTILSSNHYFKVKFHVTPENFESTCKTIFNGTLHVFGLSTTTNVYHSIADIFITLISQILMDFYLSPEFLHLPRLQLRGFQPSARHNVDHIKLIDNLFSAGSISLDASSKEKLCVRRIIWHGGPNVLYHDVFVLLRRMAADFARTFVSTFYSIPNPFENPKVKKPKVSKLGMLKDLSVYLGFGMNTTNYSQLVRNDKPLNIVLYSRGRSGRGRSMQNEVLLVNKLREAGANAIFCCDFESQVKVEDQISYAYHADVVMGMHGAALAHAVFSQQGIVVLEFKTLYAYQSILFGLITDSKLGIHSQIDVRDYWVVGGHKSVDTNLTVRVLETLKQSLSFQDDLYLNKNVNDSIHVVQKNQKTGDFFMKYSSMYIDNEPLLDHMFGPKIESLSAVCERMIFSKTRKYLESLDSEDLQCPIKC